MTDEPKSNAIQLEDFSKVEKNVEVDLNQAKAVEDSDAKQQRKCYSPAAVVVDVRRIWGLSGSLTG